MDQPRAIAHYLIERELGRGAMGVVFLATDTRLGRPVAIKSLPVDLASDPSRRDRFEAEARTLAAINHPNIGSIFGLESQDGSTYIVLEFVEGPTLTDRIREGPLPLAEALDICRQVALGIDAAHQRGIIHRDLKPDNIKIRPDGLVKVLDFGIAMAGEVMRETSSSAATLVVPQQISTRTGFIVGTPGYMSPEQARGKPVNWSTDLWALGCVLYECLTGQVAFGGESLADALASTLLTEPDLGRLPPRTPARVLDLLRHAFAKDFAKRKTTLGMAAGELAAAGQELAGGPARISVSFADDGDWPATPGNLPPRAAQEEWREPEVASAVRMRSSSRLVTITGPEGSGRSSVALAAAARTADASPAGVWRVRLPATNMPGLPALVAAFELSAKGPAPSPQEALARRIAARHVTLVLDGCHHSPTACATLARDLLYACPNVRIVACGRTELGIEGEAVLNVGSVLETLGPAEAAEKLLSLSVQSAPGMSLSADAPAAALTLVKRLRGWPLAMEIVAGMAAQIPLPIIAEQLEARGRLEGAADPQGQTPEQVHRSLLQWVLEMLPPAELAVILQASPFVSPFGVRALAAAGGARDSVPRPESDDPSGGPVTAREARLMTLLPRLAARRLIHIEGSTSDPLSVRLLLPDPVRVMVGERLAEIPASAGAVRAAREAFYVAMLECARPRWAGAGGAAWLAVIEDHYANIAKLAAEPGEGDAPATALRGLLDEFRAVRGF
ncbi:MAG: hypothetical protein DYG92_09860 [Leptolyngbya sp. PLA1]|nr:hypothetical protein [Leptolyngbya sp. PLA1]